MQHVKRLIFSLLPVLILFVACETALRAAGWPKRDPKREFSHNEVYWVEPSSLRKEAISHKETGGSFRVSTDANGLRAPLHSEEKADGVFRVMTLGCSTTFGWGVEDEEAWPYRLEEKLKAEHPNAKIEVVNGGQPGYTSFQGLWLWDKTLARYKPDLVMFGYIVQDSRMVAYTDRSQAILQGNSDFLKQSLLYNLKSYLYLKQQINGWQIQAKDEDKQTYRIPLEEYSENIQAFKKKTEAVGAKMMLFGFPLEVDGYTSEHRKLLHAAADVLSVPILDPQPQMTQESKGKEWYFPRDKGHANAAGNDVIAGYAARYLIDNKLVP